MVSFRLPLKAARPTAGSDFEPERFISFCLSPQTCIKEQSASTHKNPVDGHGRNPFRTLGWVLDMDAWTRLLQTYREQGVAFRKLNPTCALRVSRGASHLFFLRPFGKRF